MGFLFYIMAKSCNLEYNVTLSLGVALTRLVVSPRSKHGLNIATQFTCENMPYRKSAQLSHSDIMCVPVPELLWLQASGNQMAS
jgi:hypothetical protein